MMSASAGLQSKDRRLSAPGAPARPGPAGVRALTPRTLGPRPERAYRGVVTGRSLAREGRADVKDWRAARALLVRDGACDVRSLVEDERLVDDLDAVEPRLLVSVLSVAAGGCVSRPKRVVSLERARAPLLRGGGTSVQGATSASAQSAQRTSVWLKPIDRRFDPADVPI